MAALVLFHCNLSTFALTPRCAWPIFVVIFLTLVLHPWYTKSIFIFHPILLKILKLWLISLYFFFLIYWNSHFHALINYQCCVFERTSFRRLKNILLQNKLLFFEAKICSSKLKGDPYHSKCMRMYSYLWIWKIFHR